MEVTIFGAGAVGSLIAARFALAGVSAKLLARGAQLESLRAGGLTLTSAQSRRRTQPAVIDSTARLAPQDIVILCLKAQTLGAAADHVASLCSDETTLVPVLNGIPWWYYHGIATPKEGPIIDSIDPGGTVWSRLPPQRVVGCVTHIACEAVEPGVVHHAVGERFLFGEPRGQSSARVAQVSELFAGAGFEAAATDEIRKEIWLKLLGNASFNPLSVLTGATVIEMFQDRGVRSVLRALMVEGYDIATGLGIDIGIDVDQRMAMAEALGAFKSSMLQDIERGRSIELEALLGAVIEMGRKAGVEAPTMELVYALARQRASVLDCYQG